MPFSKVRVFANCDMTLIAWQMTAKIPGCLGFALQRDVDASGAAGDAKSGFVNTYVGFKGGPHTSGEAEPSTTWPIQRFTWSDYAVSQGQKVRYRVVPMMGIATALTQAPDNQCSQWSDPIVVGTEQTKGFKAYFNRGIVGAQFLARQANDSKSFNAMLKTAINNPGSKNRDFLSGPLRIALLGLLDEAAREGMTIYAALYELNDPEIIARFDTLGDKCNLLLGSGAFHAASKGKPAVTDENAVVRAQLRKAGKINLFDRLVTGNHFAHNKFIVFCDGEDKAVSVWTGSTNCTVTGLCTQVNNGLLIEDAALSAAYKIRWDDLKAAKNRYPASLVTAGSVPAKSTLGGSPMTAWNVPCLKYVDLNDARSYIQKAKQGVLFLMFNPGTGGGDRANSLLQDIQALGNKGLYLHGVINQAQTPPKKGTVAPDPSGSSATLEITDNSKLLPPVAAMAITPHALTDATKNWFHQAYQFNMVMIHSKIVLIDPFGQNAILMTGSHNMGPKASASNDDNLVIIENAPGLAAEYAVNILGVYGHYKWLYNAWNAASTTAAATPMGTKRKPVPVLPFYDGNIDDDSWQDWEMRGSNLQATQFMMGAPITPASAAGSTPAMLVTTTQAKTTQKKKPTKRAPARHSSLKKVLAKKAPAKNASKKARAKK